MEHRVTVLGVGNADRGDDGAGVAVARSLRGRVPPGVTVRECRGESSELIDAWAGADSAILIDASSSDAAPGTVRRFEAHAQSIPAATFRCSTHSFGVVEAIELARAIGNLPSRVVVLGIEGRDFSAGAELTPEVREAVADVAGEVLDLVRDGRGARMSQ